jgi:hypothetical protein
MAHTSKSAEEKTVEPNGEYIYKYISLWIIYELKCMSFLFSHIINESNGVLRDIRDKRCDEYC